MLATSRRPVPAGFPAVRDLISICGAPSPHAHTRDARPRTPPRCAAGRSAVPARSTRRRGREPTRRGSPSACSQPSRTGASGPTPPRSPERIAHTPIASDAETPRLERIRARRRTGRLANASRHTFPLLFTVSARACADPRTRRARLLYIGQRRRWRPSAQDPLRREDSPRRPRPRRRWDFGGALSVPSAAFRPFLSSLLPPPNARRHCGERGAAWLRGVVRIPKSLVFCPCCVASPVFSPGGQ